MVRRNKCGAILDPGLIGQNCRAGAVVALTAFVGARRFLRPSAAETQSEIDAARVSTRAVEAPPAIDAAFLQSSTVASAQCTRGGHAIDHTVLTFGGVPFGEGCALEQIFHVLFVICDRHNNFTACSPSLDGAKKSCHVRTARAEPDWGGEPRAFIVNISITNDL